MNKIHVIGIGYRPFTKRAREVVLNSDVILASKRLFEVFKGYGEFEEVKDKVIVINKIDETMEFIRNNLEKCSLALLASGDPLFFGIGAKALTEFGRDRVEILPDLSSVQLAFSAVKETWDDAFLMSLHGGPDPEKRRRLPYEVGDIPSLLEEHYKLAILTDKENNPAAIARTLAPGVQGHNSTLRIFVCEKLGYPEEKIVCGGPEEIAGMTFSEPNVVIITKSRESGAKGHELNGISEAVFGLTEGDLAHSRGLITKDEIRAVSLHKLRLPQEGTLWDIGAGSGSISIEAAILSPGLRVYAVEKAEEQILNIEENKRRFGARNVTVIFGEAPEASRDLPSTERVFIGGSGGRLAGIIRAVCEKMAKGIVVVNAVSLDTLNEAKTLLDNNGFGTEVSQVSVSRSKSLNGHTQMAALNPVFIVKGERK